MTVRIIRAYPPSWYADRIGQCVEVYPEPYKYAGGPGYMCMEEPNGGILKKDCEVVEK